MEKPHTDNSLGRKDNSTTGNHELRRRDRLRLVEIKPFSDMSMIFLNDLNDRLVTQSARIPRYTVFCLGTLAIFTPYA